MFQISLNLDAYIFLYGWMIVGKNVKKWKKMLTEEIFDDIIDKHSRDGQTSQKQNSKKWKKMLTKKNGYDILIWLSQESKNKKENIDN